MQVKPTYKELEQRVAELEQAAKVSRQAEMALQESEERFRAMSASAKDAIIMMDNDGKVSYWNTAASEMFGYTPKEIIGKDVHQTLAPPEYRESYEKGLTAFRHTGKGSAVGTTIELTGLKKGGSEFPIELSLSTVRRNDTSEAIAIVRDITERRRAQESLLAQKGLIHSIIESLPFDFFALDAQGRCILQNSVSRDNWGNGLGKRLEEYRLDETTLALWQDNNNRAYSGETVRENRELIVKGRKLFLHNIVAPIHQDETVTGILGVNIDITELIQAKQALRESEETYRSLVEELNDIVYSIDNNALITYVSPNIETFSGYRPAEVIGRRFIDFVHKDDLAQRIPQFLKILSGGLEATEYRMVTKTGEIRWIRTSGRPILKDGHVMGIRGILVDLTERKRAEEKRQELETQLQKARKMESLGILAGGVAHDLNNVLGGIVGLPDLLISQVADDSPLKESLKAIRKSGEKAAAIVQDLLTLARRGVKTFETVSLNKIITEHLDSLEHEQLRIYHPEVEFHTCLAEDLPEFGGSPIHLAKAVMNLLSNAAEASPAGGTTVISTQDLLVDYPISGYETVPEGRYAVLRVSDNGTGMSPLDMERIFEPFYTKKVMGRSGTGLGMAVVWGTVKDHQGFIDIESEEGKGSAFTLYFPVTTNNPVRTEGRISLEQCLGKGESIVVVDDVMEQRDLASLMLSSLGYRVQTFSSGEKAVEYMRHHTADLLVLDMIMDPGIDGLETYRRILQHHPGQKALIVSGFSETDRVRASQTLGAGAYVMKPYLREKLGLAVRTELDRR